MPRKHWVHAWPENKDHPADPDLSRETRSRAGVRCAPCLRCQVQGRSAEVRYETAPPERAVSPLRRVLRRLPWSL